MNLTKNQIEFLMEFFDSNRYPGWKSIAKKLITKGYCIVAGSKCIWIGGIGNFIDTDVAEDAVGCLRYEFDVESFIKTAYYKDMLPYRLMAVESEIKIAEERVIEVNSQYTELIRLR